MHLIQILLLDLDRSWWRRYRETLAIRYRQDWLVVRASTVELL